MSVSFTVLGTLSHKRQVQVDFPVSGLVYRVPWENIPDTPLSLQQSADNYEIGVKTEWLEWLVQAPIVGATIESQEFNHSEGEINLYNLVISWPVDNATVRLTTEIEVGDGLSAEDEEAFVQAAANAAAADWISSRPFYAQ